MFKTRGGMQTTYLYAMNQKEVNQLLKECEGSYYVIEIYKAEHTFVKAYLGR